MKIAQSAVSLSSEHQKIEEHKRQEHLVMWRKGEEPREIKRDGANDDTLQSLAISFQNQAAEVSLSEAALNRNRAQVETPSTDDGQRHYESLNMRILRKLVETLTGRKVQQPNPDEIARDIGSAERHAGRQAAINAADSQSQGSGQVNPSAEVSEGWGMTYEYNESYYEYEASGFQAKGSITTSKGQAIDFSVTLNMSRTFMSEQLISIKAGDALKDPLVFNFNTAGAELTTARYSFDIDADGSEDQISFVRPGSGFLALDRNSDGIINDGSELFGALTGNGFTELASHDDDANGWIDENDSIYNRLRIWTKDSDGNDHLAAVDKHDIGAIYLGYIPTSFDLKDEDNSLQGQVKSSGIFLREQGNAGTVQQLNLVV